jgi:CBS domain-containing protein
MAQTVSDVMTRDPATIERDDSTAEAARRMAATGAGDVIVLSNGKVCGIVTDRDIAIRLVAEDKPGSTPVGEIVTGTELTTVSPDTPLDQAIQLIRAHAVRRLPVVERDRAVGILSLGDLAIERDPESALADVSAARDNT